MEALEISVKGAEKALRMKLKEYLNGFPIKEAAQIQKRMTEVKMPDCGSKLLPTSINSVKLVMYDQGKK